MLDYNVLSGGLNLRSGTIRSNACLGFFYVDAACVRRPSSRFACE
jgi:hypothetical protein